MASNSSLETAHALLTSRIDKYERDHAAAFRTPRKLPSKTLAIARAAKRTIAATVRSSRERPLADSRLGLVSDGIGGLIQGPRPHYEHQLRLLHAAVAAAPDNAEEHRALGTCLIRVGDVATAETHFRRAYEIAPNARTAYEWSQALSRPELEDNQRAIEALNACLDHDPQFPQARSKLVRLYVACERWHEAWVARSVGSGLVPSHFDRIFATGASISDALSTLDSVVAAIDDEVPDDTLRLIAMRYQSLGLVQVAFDVHRFIAIRTVVRTRSVRGSVSTHRKRAQALTYLDRRDEALSLVSPAPWQPSDALEIEHMRQIAADVHLNCGDARPLHDFAQQRRQLLNLPADATMANLVTGKRIAVVGPAPTTSGEGYLIDRFDVVVRPLYRPDYVNQHRESIGRRTDIAYFARAHLAQQFTDTERAITHGDLQLAVARPNDLGTVGKTELPWLRFYPHQPSLYFGSGPLGVQRMLYDLLQFAPADICLFNVDFYSGTKPYEAGYRAARSPAQARFPVALFNSHDLRADFLFTRHLREAGLITAVGVSADILDLNFDQYVDLLEKSRNN